MNSFEHVSVTTLEDAFRYMKDGWDTRIIAGGTDLLGEMKHGIESPRRLVDIKAIEGLRNISGEKDVVRIGALVTLDEVEKSDIVSERYPALKQAAYEAASPQLRNMATVAGNICQRPRCWYYRNEEFPCLRKGGKTCFAAGGENTYHAVFGGGPCHIVCPSDLAPAFMAYDARIGIAGPGGERDMLLDDFFVGPKVDPHRENILKPDEIVTGLKLPLPQGETSSVFIKVRERRSWDFALASIALVVSIENGSIRNAGLVLGGVAPNPWRAAEAEQMLEGTAPGSVDPAEVAAAVIKKARPLKGNRYKVDIVQNIVRRALEAALAGRYPT